jgi:short-subunit dehydrogenase
VSITESLFRELKMDGANISASVLCPGYVNTGFNENSDRDRPRSEGDVLVPRAESSMASLPGVFQPERIADEVFAAINEDRFYIFAAQDELLGWMAMRNRRMEDGRNPAVPRRSLQ